MDAPHILQLSITPIALISGVGLLLLSMTNRLGRVIDRARVVGDAPEERDILLRRAQLLLIAILLMALSIFLAVLMVAGLFAISLSSAHLDRYVVILFGACLLCLVVSIGFFLGDIVLSIRWIKLSLGTTERSRAP